MQKILQIILTISLATTIYTAMPQKQPISPTANTTTNSQQQKQHGYTPTQPTQPPSSINSNNRYEIMGFIPYWNLKKLSPKATSTITNLAYFSIDIDENGNISKLLKPHEENPSWTGFKNFNKLNINKPITITFTIKNQTALNNILTNQTKLTKTINSILEITQQTQPNEINIDFEPTTLITTQKRQNFTKLIQEIRNKTQQLQLPIKPKISISIYPTAGINPKIWDLKNLDKYTDRFVVMTYDYHHKKTPTGPNAPLRGSSDTFQEDIIKNIKELTQKVPSNKILLGIPFYGWEWTTTSTQKYSPAKSKSVASLKRINKLIEDRNIPVLWDRVSLTPYIIYEENNELRQIYFDNHKSISLKLQLVKEANLGGIAIWALGYEGNDIKIWDTIATLNP